MDWKRIDQLREEVGEETLSEVLRMFLDETDTIVEKLNGPKQADTLEADIHFLKGAAMNIGFDSVAELCQTAETAAGQGETDRIEILPILTHYAQAREELLSRADEFGLVA